jgi:hypothetical protein
MDIKIVKSKTGELVTQEVLKNIASFSTSCFSPTKYVRPVYCPPCGRHYTIWKPTWRVWAPTVVHLVCADCGGNGEPLNLEAPR